MNTTGTVSVVIQSLMIIPGFILYLLVFIGLIATYKITKNTFYLLLISLAVADIAYLAETLFYSVPCIVLQREIYGKVMERVIGHLDTTTWFLQCSHVLFISMNRLRFVAATSIQTFDKVFSRWKTFICLLIIWIFSFAMTGMSEAVFCNKYFDESKYYWTFSCSSDKTNSTNVGMVINNVVSGVFCLSSGVLYAITWLIVKYKANSTIRATTNGRRVSNELSLLIQASAITACLVLNYLGFWLFSKVLPSSTATIMIQIFAVANSSINPYIYLLFNRTVRMQVWRVMNCKRPAVSSSVQEKISMTEK